MTPSHPVRRTQWTTFDRNVEVVRAAPTYPLSDAQPGRSAVLEMSHGD
ncbi:MULTISPECIES: hypothetical protein [unclassified Kribbella]